MCGVITGVGAGVGAGVAAGVGCGVGAGVGVGVSSRGVASSMARMMLALTSPACNVELNSRHSTVPW